jgi:antitoxin HigA-1
MRTKEKKSQIIDLHPGQFLQDELDTLGISQVALAKRIGTTQAQINDICRGKRGISADMAVRLSRALGASAEYWLNLQALWELSQVAEEHDDIEPFNENIAA